jgi:shikimate kinase
MTERTQPIIITGFMGAGKTTVARALARRLACSMIDLDRFIEERESRTAQAIIERNGEQRFREIESAALREALTQRTARIIALGGGAWTISDNRALVSRHEAFTVWLDAPFELCWERIIGGNNARPLARNINEARRLYDERRPLYDQTTLRVEISEDQSAEVIAAKIIKALPPLAESNRQTG